MKEVPIIEAANTLGISVDTVRRRISKGELKTRKVPSPHGETYLVEITDDASPVPPDLQRRKKRILQKSILSKQ